MAGIDCNGKPFEDFLKGLFEALFLPGDVVEIRGLPKSTGGKKTARPVVRHFKVPEELSQLVKYLSTLDSQVHAGERGLIGLYFGVHPRKLKKPYGKASNTDNVKFALVLYHDLDLFKDVGKRGGGKFDSIELKFDGIKVKASKQWAVENKEVVREFLSKVGKAISERLRVEGIEPMLVVDSGFGLHLYIKLDKVITDWEQYKALHEYVGRKLISILSELLGVDYDIASELVDFAVSDPARLTRVPCTHNARLAYSFADDGSVSFSRDKLMLSRVLFFDPDAMPLNIENTLEEVRTLRRGESAGVVSPAKKILSTESMNLGLGGLWDKYIQKHDYNQAVALAREKGVSFVEIEDEEVIEKLARLLLWVYPLEGNRNNFFFRFPSFFLLRGLGPETTMKIFDKAFQYAISLGFDSEREIRDRVSPTVRSIVNFLKWKSEEWSGNRVPPAGWKGLVFETRGQEDAHWKDLPVRGAVISDLTWKLKNIQPHAWEMVGVAPPKVPQGVLDDYERRKEFVSRLFKMKLASLEELVNQVVKSARKPKTVKGKKKKSGRGRPTKAEAAAMALTEEERRFIANAIRNAPVRNVHEKMIAILLDMGKEVELATENIEEYWSEIFGTLRLYYSEAWEEVVVDAIKNRVDMVTRPTTSEFIITFRDNAKVSLPPMKRLSGDYEVQMHDNGLAFFKTGGRRIVQPKKLLSEYDVLNAHFERFGYPLYLRPDEVMETIRKVMGVSQVKLLMNPELYELAKVVKNAYYFFVSTALEGFINRKREEAPEDLEREDKELLNSFINFVVTRKKVEVEDLSNITNTMIFVRKEEDEFIVPKSLLKTYYDAKWKELRPLVKLLKNMGLLITELPVTIGNVVVLKFSYRCVRQLVLRERGIDIEEDVSKFNAYDLNEEVVKREAYFIAESLFEGHRDMYHEVELSHLEPELRDAIIREVQRIAAENFGFMVVVNGEVGQRVIRAVRPEPENPQEGVGWL